MLSFLEKARKKPATMNRTMISLIMAFLAILWLVFSGIQDASLFFYFPTEVEQSITSDEMEQDARIRIGGFVQPDSISVEDEVIFFVLTDDERGVVRVRYEGILPDMFAEGQGAVAEGIFPSEVNNGYFSADEWIFYADDIFVKHGEEYSKEHLDKTEMKKRFGSGIPSGTLE